MLSVVADETARRELRVDLDELVEGARRMLAAALQPRSTSIWLSTPASGMSAAGGWWCAPWPRPPAEVLTAAGAEGAGAAGERPPHRPGDG